MRHFTTSAFWECYDRLPHSTKGLADKKFELLKADPEHPSLYLKKTGRYWSVRIGIRYRALAVETEEELLWFWIGTHSEYDQLVK
jgi:hypothetical protein